MKNLFTIDLKDYDSTWQTFVRPSVRGIILKEENKIAMVYSQKYHYYKFPGGGIEKNESHQQTLAREIKEETGMTLIPESVMEFGKVSRIQKKDDTENTIFYQENYYYICKTEPEIKPQEFDEDEKDAEFVLKIVTIDEAIKTNESFNSNDNFKNQMIEREKRVLEIVKQQSLH